MICINLTLYFFKMSFSVGNLLHKNIYIIKKDTNSNANAYKKVIGCLSVCTEGSRLPLN